MKNLRPVFAKAFKNMRKSARLSQVDVEDLTTDANWPYQTLTASKLSNIERGVTSPSMASLISMVVLYSEDRATLNFGRFQRFLESAARSDELLKELFVEPSEDPQMARALVKISEHEDRINKLEQLLEALPFDFRIMAMHKVEIRPNLVAGLDRG